MSVKRRFTEEEDAVIRAHADTRTYEAIGAMLGRSYNSVQARALALGIARFRRGPDWSDEEIAKLRQLFPVMSTADLAAKLDRSAVSIKSQATRLGLRKDVRQVRIGRRNGARATNGRAALMGHPYQRSCTAGAGDYSPTQDAARHLQRIAPIWRCRADGTADPKGAHWKFSGRVMTAADVEARAERAGWVRP